jgi:hypothetical protein
MRAVKFTRKLFISLLILSVLSNSLFAQKTASTKKAAAPKCSGAWTGTVTYTRTQSANNDKTVERVSGRGKDTTHFEMSYNYTAQAVIAESPAMDGTSIAKATINHTMTSKETVHGVESNSCDRGKSWKEMSGTSTSTSSTTGDGRGEANFNVGMNADGTYSVSIGMPEIQGKVTGSQSSTFSGQCTPKEGKSSSLPATPISLDGHSLTSDGTTRVDLADPNHISGSYSLKTPGDVTETITWSLKRCGGALQINDLKFEDMKFPTWDDWKEITEQVGTIDGNWVKVKAKVINTSGETKFAEVYFKETYKGDKWDGAKPDMPLKDETFSVRLEPGEERDVEMLWDTSGYAWFDDGRPRLVQRVKAEVWENYKLQDDMTKNIKIAPKPVVLVHDIWSHWKEFETWQNILTTSHSYDWKAFPVGEVTNKGIINTGREMLSSEQTNTTEQNAASLTSYIKYAQEDRNAWHVDIVAHGIGGIISRYYIDRMMPGALPDGRPKVSHLVMLGTPNEGAQCANVMDTTFGVFDANVRAVQQLRTSVMAEFNRTNDNRKGVKMSVLAGNPLPFTCYTAEWNDGMVTVPSAFHNFTDTATSKSLHPDLVSTKDFSDFVKPHLAIGPRGDHNPAMPTITMGQYDDELYRPQNQYATVGFTQQGGDVKPDIFFGKGTKLAAKQLVEIEIPIPADTDGFGLTFLASPSISATLVDANGNELGKNVKGTPEANAMFRSIIVPKNLSGTTIKLRLQSDLDLEAVAVFTVWKKPNRP